jgi:hypothetical protein
MLQAICRAPRAFIALSRLFIRVLYVYWPAVQAKALHGEQYVELKASLPSAAQVATSAQVVDVQDKGSGAAVVLRTVSIDVSTGQELAVNEFTT